MIRVWDRSKPPTGPFVANKDSAQAIGLLRWWPMGVGTLSQPELMNGFESNLVATGTPVPSMGVYGQKTSDFNGSSYYSAPYGSYLDLPSLSVMCNVRFSFLSGVDYYALMSRYDGFSDFWLEVTIVAGKIALYFNDGTQAFYDGNGLYTLSSVSTPTHIAATISSSALRGYMNGLQDASASGWAGSGIPNASDFVVGAEPAIGRQVFGTIDDVRIYNIELSAQMLLEINDPGRKFELWYPLRSRKWISAPAAAGFKPGWARGSNQIIGGGAYVS